MMSENIRLKPAGWQVTATTVKCDRVDDFVTIMVNKDWSVHCSWYNRYKKAASGTGKRRLDAGLKKKIDCCIGPQCDLVTGYRDRLIREEFGG